MEDYSKLTDAELIARCQNADDKAWQAFVAGWERYVRAVAEDVLGKGSEEAEKVRKEVFMRAEQPDELNHFQKQLEMGGSLRGSLFELTWKIANELLRDETANPSVFARWWERAIGAAYRVLSRLHSTESEDVAQDRIAELFVGRSATDNYPDFVNDDIRDLPAIVTRLSPPKSKDRDPVANFLWCRFSESMRDKLQSFDAEESGSTKTQRDLVKELNILIRGPAFWEDPCFGGLKLSEATQRLRYHNPKDEESLAQLHRLLLEDAFQGQLAGSKKELLPWVKADIQSGKNIQGYLSTYGKWRATDRRKSLTRKGYTFGYLYGLPGANAREQPGQPEPQVKPIQPKSGTDSTPDSKQDFEFIRNALDQLLDNLTPLVRQQVELHYLRKLTAKEIAIRLGIKVNSVTATLSKAKKALRQKLRNRPDLLDYLRVEPSVNFLASDFKNLPGFMDKLLEGMSTDVCVSQLLWSKFSPNLQAEIESLEKEARTAQLDKIAHLLTKEFNEIILDQELYRHECFTKLPVSEETKKFREQQPTGKSLVRLNRMLLEDAYPAHLVKHKKPKD